MQINGGVTVRVRKGVLDFPSESSENCKKELCGQFVEFGKSVIEFSVININEINTLL